MNNDFSSRVNYAATCIHNKTTGGRSFDNCFEMWDGDYVVAALVRRARKSEKFMHSLVRYLRTYALLKDWVGTAKRFDHLSNKELREEANQVWQKAKKEVEDALIREGFMKY